MAALVVAASITASLSAPVSAQSGLGSSSLGPSGSLGSSGGPGPIEPEEPVDGFDELVKDPVTGARTAVGVGGLVFPKRSVTLENSDATITASTVPELPDAVVGQWLSLAVGGFASGPIEYEAAPGVAAAGVTITQSYSEPIPDGAFYSIIYYDEEVGDWFPAETEISPDRRTLSTSVDHLSLWDAVVWINDRVGEGSAWAASAGSQIIDSTTRASEAMYDSASGALVDGWREFYDEALFAIGNPEEALYKGWSSFLGIQVDPPSCEGDMPTWMEPVSESDFPNQTWSAVKYCAGVHLADPSKLEVKATLNRSYPMFASFEPEPVDVVNDTYRDLSTPEDLISAVSNPSSAYAELASVLGGSRMVAPENTIVMLFEKDDIEERRLLQVEFDQASLIESVIMAESLRLLDGILGPVVGDPIKQSLALLIQAPCRDQASSLAEDAIDGTVSGGWTGEFTDATIACLANASENAVDQLSPNALIGVGKDQIADQLKKVKVRLGAIGIGARISYSVLEYQWMGNYESPLVLLAALDGGEPSPGDGSGDVVSISAGGEYSCAVLKNGTAACWGFNGDGRLGDGTETRRPSPTPVEGIRDAVSISAGTSHSCAVLRNGTAACWGNNSFGQLGDGTTTRRLTPVPVEGLSKVVSIEAGNAHSCAVLEDGSVFCWGFNNYGQLGDGTLLNRHTPVAVSGLSDVLAISTGGYHSCAILGNGSATCWGANSDGRLGDGTTTERRTPVPVVGLSDVINISASDANVYGDGHTCAILGNGSATCWGANSDGRLGDGTTTERHAPVPVVGLSDVLDISTGGFHSCAILETGAAACWGSNSSWQLGDGTHFTHDSRHTPVAVEGLSGGVAVDVGAHHSCAILQNGSAGCWGSLGYTHLRSRFHIVIPFE